MACMFFYRKSVGHPGNIVADAAVGGLCIGPVLVAVGNRPVVAGPLHQPVFQKIAVELGDDALGLLELAMDQKVTIDIVVEKEGWGYG